MMMTGLLLVITFAQTIATNNYALTITITVTITERRRTAKVWSGDFDELVKRWDDNLREFSMQLRLCCIVRQVYSERDELQ